MRYSYLTYHQSESIVHITLGRPETGNIINQPLAQELRDVCKRINQDESIRVAVLSGSGTRAFCLGSELEHIQEKQIAKTCPTTELTSLIQNYSAANSIANVNCPTIAVINGDALGQGLELALSCDIRIASDIARFGFPGIASGNLAMDGGTQRLPRLIGRGKSLEMILTGELMDAEEAQRVGLINKTVPGERLTSEGEEWANRIASKAPLALKYTKEVVNKGLDLTLEQGLHLEADLYFLLHTTRDRTEGIQAFREKRSPQFEGQ